MAADSCVPGTTDNKVEALNSGCFCLTMNPATLRDALARELNTPGLFELVQERCQFMFSSRPVFVSEQHLQQMADVISAVESVVALPEWQSLILQSAPLIAQRDPGGVRGVFFGYDFHIGENTLGLIEINTNAGGAMLNAVLARAQLSCCPEIDMGASQAHSASQLEQAIVSMFRNEWQLSGRAGPLRTVAIVDEAPTEQYLYPEFLLFADLFQRHGIKAVIAGPDEYELRDGVFWCGETAIDLVYNRLTDFLLEQPGNAHLRQAWLEQAIVLTPHPQAHALYANKRNLAFLTDAGVLDDLGVSAAIKATLLKGIPRTEVVKPADADRLWRERKQLFFKPASGFGSRAAWRGDKLTKRVWQEILEGDYVAQALVQPGQRTISASDPPRILKFDLRNYVYEGKVQWTAARLYQGQTTNFRTEGGGFAPVYRTPANLTKIAEPSEVQNLR